MNISKNKLNTLNKLELSSLPKRTLGVHLAKIIFANLFYY